MTDIIKHECGIAVIRLLKPLNYYYKKYGTWQYGLDKLYLLMEKQHNRGQEGAGLGAVKLESTPGNEFIYRERAVGSSAISEIFSKVHSSFTAFSPEQLNDIEFVKKSVPYAAELFIGHLRYSTTGKSGLTYVHPLLRRNNWASRNLALAGNFNMTNVDERREKRLSNLSLVSDLNEQIAYLRASVIGLLVAECTKVFMENEDLILSGKFEGSLIKKLPERVKNAYKTCSEFAFEKIYRSKDVLDVELAGYRIIGFLLETFTNAILTPDHTYSKLLLDRIPEQYETDSPSLYSKIQSVIDYISGMTDVYALDLYHKLTGIGLPIV